MARVLNFQHLLTWTLTLRDLHFPVSILSFQEEEKFIIQFHNTSFSTSSGWDDKSFIRHKLDSWACTSISQMLPKQLQHVIINFYAVVTIFMRIGKYTFSLAGNIDEIPSFFDMVPSKPISKKGDRHCGSLFGEWKETPDCYIVNHVRWTMLLSMIIFRGKSDQSILNQKIFPGLTVKRNKRFGWMTLWWKFGLRRFGWNMLRLSVRG